MKSKAKTIFFLFFVIFFIGIIYYVYKTPKSELSVSPSATSVNNPVFFPTASDKLKAGQIYNLSWAEDPNVGTIQLFLVSKSLEGQGESVSIVDRSYNVPNTGHYSYTVPIGMKAGQYKFEIGNLKSDYFQIIN